MAKKVKKSAKRDEAGQVRQAMKDAEHFKLYMLPVSALTPADYNPRTISDENYQALKTSLEKDPDFMKARPIIVNTEGGRLGVVIAGNQRLRAAKELGWKKEPVVLVDVPEEKEKVWNIKDNVNQGEFVPEQLSELLGGLRDEGIDLSGIGFNPEETVDLLDLDTTDVSPEEDPENTGTTPAGGGKPYRECPSCGFVGHKREFVKLSEEETGGEEKEE